MLTRLKCFWKSLGRIFFESILAWGHFRSRKHGTSGSDRIKTLSTKDGSTPKSSWIHCFCALSGVLSGVLSGPSHQQDQSSFR